jgi:hypothetical protein
MALNGLFSSIGHAAVIATVAAVALTAVVPAVAEAQAAGKGLSGAPAPRDTTDFSARRRYHHGGGTAAAGAFAAMGGAGLAVGAPRNRGAYDNGGYDCSPLYCGPNYYGSDGYYRGYGSGGGSSTPAVAW